MTPATIGPVAVVVSRFNRWITDQLEEGALAEHARLTKGGGCGVGCGVGSEVGGGVGGGVVVIEAPGSFELPVIALAAARSGRFDAVVCLGCIIKGETSHDRHIASAVAQGIARVSIQTGVPVAFGVLTVDSADQAEARAGIGAGAIGNKGAEAMAAALATAGVIAALNESVRQGTLV